MNHLNTFKRLLVTLGVLFLVAQILACKGSTSVDSGTLDTGIYSSDFFGFSLTLPDDWHPLDQGGMSAVIQAGGSAVAGKNQKIKASVQAAKNGSYNLVMAYEHPVGTRVPFNPAIGAVAQKVDKLPGVNSGRDYLLYIKRYMANSRVRMSFSPKIERVNIDGIDFDYLYAEVNTGRTVVSQEYYASVQKGYVLSFLISYVEDEQYDVLQESIESIMFY